MYGLKGRQESTLRNLFATLHESNVVNSLRGFFNGHFIQVFLRPLVVSSRNKEYVSVRYVALFTLPRKSWRGSLPWLRKFNNPRGNHISEIWYLGSAFLGHVFGMQYAGKWQ